MKLQLPPLIDGTPPVVDTSSRPVVVIGANGSGKTRFARHIADTAGKKAFHLSALRALYRPVDGSDAGSVSALYDRAVAGSALIRNDLDGELNRLIALLLQEEMINLLDYKTARASKPQARLKPTRLDSMIALWQEIFPGNRVLLDSGRLSIWRDVPPEEGGGNANAFSVLRLSDGEKAVMYLIGAALFAPADGVIIIDNPGIFLHPSTIRTVWDAIEQLRPDCTFVYVTHDLSFAATRGDTTLVWVRDYVAAAQAWRYEILQAADGISEDVYMAIVGDRKPVLFIEGDGKNSIDAKLYPLIFKEYSVKSLGSCNKVIEATRAFNDLSTLHSLDSHGIVDRDRRDEKEVAYLRGRKIHVPDVAEIENILMLEEVVRAVATFNRRSENQAFAKVHRAIVKLFSHDLKAQALLHTRHRVKTTVEHRIDGRFNNINGLEEHMTDLMHEINPRGLYEQFCRDFRRFVADSDYAAILRVYNRKSMIAESNVGVHCGLRKSDKNTYINAILNILRSGAPEAERIRLAIKHCFDID